MKELYVVKLIQEFNGLPIGTAGTIVHKYDDSMYEVEFFVNPAVHLMWLLPPTA